MSLSNEMTEKGIHTFQTKMFLQIYRFLINTFEGYEDNDKGLICLFFFYLLLLP